MLDRNVSAEIRRRLLRKNNQDQPHDVRRHIGHAGIFDCSFTLRFIVAHTGVQSGSDKKEANNQCKLGRNGCFGRNHAISLVNKCFVILPCEGGGPGGRPFPPPPPPANFPEAAPLPSHLFHNTYIGVSTLVVSARGHCWPFIDLGFDEKAAETGADKTLSPFPWGRTTNTYYICRSPEKDYPPRSVAIIFSLATSQFLEGESCW